MVFRRSIITIAIIFSLLGSAHSYALDPQCFALLMERANDEHELPRELVESIANIRRRLTQSQQAVFDEHIDVLKNLWPRLAQKVKDPLKREFLMRSINEYVLEFDFTQGSFENFSHVVRLTEDGMTHWSKISASCEDPESALMAYFASDYLKTNALTTLQLMKNGELSIAGLGKVKFDGLTYDNSLMFPAQMLHSEAAIAKNRAIIEQIAKDLGISRNHPDIQKLLKSVNRGVEYHNGPSASIKPIDVPIENLPDWLKALYPSGKRLVFWRWAYTGSVGKILQQQMIFEDGNSSIPPQKKLRTRLKNAGMLKVIDGVETVVVKDPNPARPENIIHAAFDRGDQAYFGIQKTPKGENKFVGGVVKIFAETKSLYPTQLRLRAYNAFIDNPASTMFQIRELRRMAEIKNLPQVLEVIESQRVKVQAVSRLAAKIMLFDPDSERIWMRYPDGRKVEVTRDDQVVSEFGKAYAAWTNRP